MRTRHSRPLAIGTLLAVVAALTFGIDSARSGGLSRRQRRLRAGVVGGTGLLWLWDNQPIEGPILLDGADHGLTSADLLGFAALTVAGELAFG